MRLEDGSKVRKQIQTLLLLIKFTVYVVFKHFIKVFFEYITA